jgi:hypothetical protein
MCQVQPIVLRELHALAWASQNFWIGSKAKRAQRCVLGVLHNIIVFMICTMSMWTLNNFIGEDMSFVPCKGTKKKRKRPCKKPLCLNHVIKTIILLGKYNPSYCIPLNKNPMCLTSKDIWPPKTTIYHQMSNKTLNHKVTLWLTLLDIQQGTRNLGQLPKWMPLTYNKSFGQRLHIACH